METGTQIYKNIGPEISENCKFPKRERFDRKFREFKWRNEGTSNGTPGRITLRDCPLF